VGRNLGLLWTVEAETIFVIDNENNTYSVDAPGEATVSRLTRREADAIAKALAKRKRTPDGAYPACCCGGDGSKRRTGRRYPSMREERSQRH
jgi:hypothetical protein